MLCSVLRVNVSRFHGIHNLGFPVDGIDVEIVIKYGFIAIYEECYDI